MGVPGLWDILRPAGQQRSLTQLAVHDGFELNPDGRRGLRVGIDASIWFYHAQSGREGENPELRLLFFRCARLMSKPFLPLFVFDGPRRPELKRKKKVSGKDHWMISGMQEIIEAFGFEYWCAPGEAEAELAYLNRIGVIDAIVTDDVDTFLFGATNIIRNNGKLLTGNNAHVIKNTAGKDDGEHTYTYSSSTILTHPDIGLSVPGLILIALLCGGDYDTGGLPTCGPNTALGLARCGFGESLLQGASTCSAETLPAFLEGWRAEVRTELRTNAHGLMKTKKPKLAGSLGEDFPRMDILHLYTHPETSERKGRIPECKWEREPDLGKLAALCERKFEWGVRELIVKRFRTVIWAPAVLRILRRAVLNKDAAGPSTPRKRITSSKIGAEPPGTPARMIAQRFSSQSHVHSDSEEEEGERLIRGIHGKRAHASTDGMPEYRLEIAPSQLVRLTEAGVLGTRVLPAELSDSEDNGEEEDADSGGGGKKRRKGEKKEPPDPASHLRVWMPACIVERVEPGMVAAYEGRISEKEREKEEKAARKAARAAGGSVSPVKPKSKPKPRRRKPMLEEEEEEELEAEEDFSHIFGISGSSRGTSKGTTKGKGKGKGKMGSRLISNHTPPIGEDEDSTDDEDVADKFPPSKIKATAKPGPKPRPKAKAAPLSEATNSNCALDNDLALPPEIKSRPRTPTKMKPSAKVCSTGTGTSTAGRKNILELLEERYPSRSGSGSSLASRPANTMPMSVGGERLMAPRPFPMELALSDEDENIPELKPYRAPLTRLSGSKGIDIERHISACASGSDLKDLHVSQLLSPIKAPLTQERREANPDIYDAGIGAGADSDWDMASSGRAVSPSPVRPRPTSPTARRIENDGTSSPVSSQTQVWPRELLPTMHIESVSRSTSIVSATLKKPSSTSKSQAKTRSPEVIVITSSSESEGAPMLAPVRVKAAPSKRLPTARRVDDTFKIITGKKKVGSNVPNKTGSSRPRPIFNVEDVIEID